jgi:hypothetical protein
MSGKQSRDTSRKIRRKTSPAAGAALALATLAVSLGTQSAGAGYKRTAPVAHSLTHSPGHRYAIYRTPRSAQPQTLPYGPEYGFLTHVPPNAIRMPGYIFVPGVGILGESCDLPTSACTNEYRDHM